VIGEQMASGVVVRMGCEPDKLGAAGVALIGMAPSLLKERRGE